MKDDLEVLSRALDELTVQPRVERDRWTHLSLCVLDAVFSIGVRYTGVVRVCHRYADHAHLSDPCLPATDIRRIVGTTNEQPVRDLATQGREYGADRFAAKVLVNRGRTSPRKGVLKADAAIRYAEILSNAQVNTIGDVGKMLADPVRLEAVERDLRLVPGNGANDIRLKYLWMLAGDDHQVKPDRMTLRWLATALDRPIDAHTARRLLGDLAEVNGHTPWEVDHAIWRWQSKRR